MTTSGGADPGFTRFPCFTSRLPVLPEIGALMVALSRLNWMLASEARSASTTCFCATAFAAAWSACDLVTKSLSTSAEYRSASRRAFSDCASSRASTARAWSSAAWNGRGSISNRSWPARTSSPSLNRTRLSTPPTCDCTATVCMGSTRPFAITTYGAAPSSAAATVTATGGRVAGAGLEHPAATIAIATARTTERCKNTYGLPAGLAVSERFGWPRGPSAPAS